MKYFQNYSDIEKLHSSSIRGLLRNTALSALAAIDKFRGIENDLSKPRIQFLYIHHIFKDEEIYLDNLIKKLLEHHTFISYSEAVNKILNCEIDKPYIVISSDDGFKNNFRAAEILNKYNISACFFINPAIIGQTDFNFIKSYCAEKLEFPPVEFLNWEEVNQLQKLGHEIGSHTMSHINLAKVSVNEVEDDMNKTFSIINKHCGVAKHFAFPYGRFSDFNESARMACFKAGFISFASAQRGCHINHDKKLSKEELFILRDHIILTWNMNHIFYFMANNARKANIANNLYSLDKKE